MGDITTGYPFTVGETNITDVKLNTVVGSAVISSTFVSTKNTVADNPDPATHLLLFLDPSTSTYYKGALNKLFAHTSLINGNTAITTLAGTESFPVYDGANKRITADNIFKSARMFAPQTAYTAPLKADKLLIYDAANSLTKAITLGNLIHGADPLAAVAGAADEILIGNGTDTFQRITVNNLFGSAGDITAPVVDAAADTIPINDVSASRLRTLSVKGLFRVPVQNGTSSLSTGQMFVCMTGTGAADIPTGITIDNLKTQLLSELGTLVATEGSADEATGTGTAYDVNINYSITTNLSAIPKYYKLVLVNLQADGSYVAGDEIPAECILSNASTGAATVSYYIDPADSYKCHICILSSSTTNAIRALTKGGTTSFALQVAATRKWAWRIKWIT